MSFLTPSVIPSPSVSLGLFLSTLATLEMSTSLPTPAKAAPRQVRPLSRSPEVLLGRLQGFSFPAHIAVHKRTDSRHRTWTEVVRRLEDEDAALAAIRLATGYSDVEVLFEGEFLPPGEYPRFRLFVMLNDTGTPVQVSFE